MSTHPEFWLSVFDIFLSDRCTQRQNPDSLPFCYFSSHPDQLYIVRKGRSRTSQRRVNHRSISFLSWVINFSKVHFFCSWTLDLTGFNKSTPAVPNCPSLERSRYRGVQGSENHLNVLMSWVWPEQLIFVKYEYRTIWYLLLSSETCLMNSWLLHYYIVIILYIYNY